MKPRISTNFLELLIGKLEINSEQIRRYSSGDNTLPPINWGFLSRGDFLRVLYELSGKKVSLVRFVSC